MNKIKLFCFPYAGGSSTIYHKWEPLLDPSITLKAIELAGRGRRMQEPLYADVPAAVDDLFRIIRKEMDQSPYALFGHSMGSMLAYELAQKIREAGLPRPMHIFFSGRKAPHVHKKNARKYHLMNDAEFRKELIDLGGTPPDFFQHPELLELFLPLLKNDFRLSETEVEGLPIRPLDCNITVFLGKDEDLLPEQCDGWKVHTRKVCSIHYFEGGHFFLHQETAGITQLINNTLLINATEYAHRAHTGTTTTGRHRLDLH